MKPKKFRYNGQRELPPSSKPPVSPEEKKRKLKKALILLIISAVAYAVLKLFLELGYLWIFIVFELSAAIPIIVYVIIVRGRMGKLPLPEELPESWTDEEKLQFIETEKQRKKDGRVYLYIAFPLVAAVLVAFVTEFYLPMLFGA